MFCKHNFQSSTKVVYSSLQTQFNFLSWFFFPLESFALCKVFTDSIFFLSFFEKKVLPCVFFVWRSRTLGYSRPPKNIPSINIPFEINVPLTLIKRNRFKEIFFNILTSDVFQLCPLDQLVPKILRCGHYCVYGQIKSTTFGQLQQCFYGGQLLSQSNMWC